MEFARRSEQALTKRAEGNGATPIEFEFRDKRSGTTSREAMYNLTERNLMLWTIIVILLVLWLLGFIGHFGGALIHLLLVIAVIVLIINLIGGRRRPL